MQNMIALAMVHLVQRLSMALTAGCCIYIVFFLFFKGKDNSVSNNGKAVPAISSDLMARSPVFDGKPGDATALTRIRDVFSIAPAETGNGGLENTPAGQLPQYLKIVGIVIAHPSQIIIEDTSANKTYFIDEGSIQDGIKIARVLKDRMIINYLGQDIPVPVHRD
jgi:hypothetical protein